MRIWYVLFDGGETSGYGPNDDSTNYSYHKKFTPHAQHSIDNCSDVRQRNACNLQQNSGAWDTADNNA